MNTYNLHHTSMLAYISISMWSGMKLDKRASQQVVADAGATADAARVNKRLLAGADSLLADIRRIGCAARVYLDTVTLPWDDAGNRLLPNAKAIEVIGRVGEFKQEFMAAVDAFVAEYPLLRQQAIAALGDLANDDDYPPTDSIRRKFDFRVTFTPIPDRFKDDVRFGLTDEQVEALEKLAEARMREQHSRALVAAYQRLLDDLKNFNERMTRNDDGSFPRFKDATIENLKATAEALGPLNVFNDPDLEAMRQRVLTEFCQYDPKAYRTSDTLRDEAAAKSKAVVDELLGLLGG